MEAYQPLWPLDESVTLLPWLKFGVTVCQDNNGHQQRLPGWLLNSSWSGCSAQSPAACFRGSVLTHHRRRQQRRQRGKLTLVSTHFRAHQTPNQTGSSRMLLSEGATVSSGATRQSHYGTRSPTTLISNQPPPKKSQKPRGAKPAVITGQAEDWP